LALRPCGAPGSEISRVPLARVRGRKVLLVSGQVSDSDAGRGDADHTAQQDFATEQT